MTRGEALAVRSLAVLEAMRGAGIPTKISREFDELRAELGQWVREVSTGEAVELGVVERERLVEPYCMTHRRKDVCDCDCVCDCVCVGRASASYVGVKPEDAQGLGLPCPTCGGAKQVSLPKRYIGEKTKAVDCDTCGGEGQATR